MKIKSLMVLILAAMVFVVLAIVSNRQEARHAPAALGKKVIPDLPINDVASITLSTANATLNVSRVQDRWTVPSHYNYPADFSKISRLLLTLADLKIGQVTRLTPAMNSELGLVSPSAQAAGQTNGIATQITLADKQGKIMASLLLGKPHQRVPAANESAAPMSNYPDGRYMTLDGKEAFLVMETFAEYSPLVRSWLDEKFLEINAADLHRLHISEPGATPLTLVKVDDKSEWALEGLTTNEVLNTDRISQLTGLLGYLQFTDIADPALTPDQTGMDKPVVIDASTRDGHHYTLRLGKSLPQHQSRYLQVAVAFEPPAQPVTKAPEASTGKTNRVDQVKDADLPRKSEAVKALNARLSSWIFMINEANAEGLIPPRTDLLQKPGSMPQAGEPPLMNPMTGNSPEFPPASP